MAAKKRGRRKPPEVEELEREELEPAEREEWAEPVEDDILGEIDDESRYAVSVFRKIESGPRSGRPEYVGRMLTSDFSLDAVKERFGGGTFEIRTLRRDERTNREKITRTRTVYVAGPPRAVPLDSPPLVGSPVAVVPAPQSEELRQLAEDNRRLRRLVKRALLEDKQPKRDPLDYFEKAAATLGAIVKPPRGNGVEELAAMFGLFMKMLDRTNRAPAETGLERFLDNVTPAVVGALQEGKPANGAVSASSQTAPPPAIAANGAANGAGPAVHKLAPVWLQRAQPHFGSLYAFAKNGQDPAQVVALLLQYLDAETRDAIGEAAESEKFVEQTLAALPPVFRGADVILWVTRFLQLLQNELAPAEEGTEP